MSSQVCIAVYCFERRGLFGLGVARDRVSKHYSTYIVLDKMVDSVVCNKKQNA